MSLLSAASSTATCCKNPFANTTEKKLSSFQPSQLLHNGLKTHKASYSKDPNSFAYKKDEHELAMLHDDVTKEYLKKCFDLTLVEPNFFSESEQPTSTLDDFKMEIIKNHQYFKNYKHSFFSFNRKNKLYAADMALAVSGYMSDLSTREIDDLIERQNDVIGYREPDTAHKITKADVDSGKYNDKKIIKVYLLHSLILKDCLFFNDELESLQGQHRTVTTNNPHDADAFFPIISVDWSITATLAILRFFYTRELSANVIKTEILNELCEIAHSLKHEDIDFALTCLKRKSLNAKQAKLNPFKKPKLTNETTNDGNAPDPRNNKKNKKSKKKSTQPPKKNKNSKNPFDNGDENGNDDMTQQKAPSSFLIDKFVKDTAEFRPNKEPGSDSAFEKNVGDESINDKNSFFNK